MAGAMRKMGIYLGLVEDDEDRLDSSDDYDDYDDVHGRSTTSPTRTVSRAAPERAAAVSRGAVALDSRPVAPYD